MSCKIHTYKDNTMKNNLVKLFLVSFSILFLFGCATNKEFRKITSSQNQVSITGVTVMPPQGKGWYLKKRKSSYMMFGQLGSSRDQSIVGAILLAKLPKTVKTPNEFLALISELRSREITPNRFENILNKETLTSEKGKFCVRYHTIYKDFNPTNLPKSSKFLIVEDIGMICRHPYNKNVAVNMAFSQRTLPANKIKNFEILANEFIKKVKFKPF